MITLYELRIIIDESKKSATKYIQYGRFLIYKICQTREKYAESPFLFREIYAKSPFSEYEFYAESPFFTTKMYRVREVDMYQKQKAG